MYSACSVMATSLERYSFSNLDNLFRTSLRFAVPNDGDVEKLSSLFAQNNIHTAHEAGPRKTNLEELEAVDISTEC